LPCRFGAASIAARAAASKPLRYNRDDGHLPMPTRPFRLVLTLALFCAGAAQARQVYKCTSADGHTAFQDTPCAPSTSESVLQIERESAPVPDAPLASSGEPAGEPKPPAPAPRPRKPLPTIWLCTNAEDGSHYANRTGPPPPRLVPLALLGYSSKSMADSYGAAAGANAMSAPEFSKPPIDRSPAASAAASYTQIQDACVVATPEQTCAWLRQQYEQTSDKLQHARFKDEQGRLQPQVDELESDLGGC
jgi:hypothetical protein